SQNGHAQLRGPATTDTNPVRMNRANSFGLLVMIPFISISDHPVHPARSSGNRSNPDRIPHSGMGSVQTGCRVFLRAHRRRNLMISSAMDQSRFSRRNTVQRPSPSSDPFREESPDSFGHRSHAVPVEPPLP